MQEDPFVTIAQNAAKEVLAHPLKMVRGKNLLYQIMINNRLEVDVDLQDPKRGQSAFQTDLCVVEAIENELEIPRVVLEFKKKLSTHDVIIYSDKASKHKRIYPYLRYGIVIGNQTLVPGKFFTHNEGMDFCVAAASHEEAMLKETLRNILRSEVEASRKIEKIIYGQSEIRSYRLDVHFEERPGPVI